MAKTSEMTFPKIGKRIWLELRQRFAKSIPSKVGPDIIISISEMTEASARSNVLKPLVVLGILQDDGKPTELAQRWRHDDEYQSVCHEIREQVYPPNLIEAFPDGHPDEKDKIKSWFMRATAAGEPACRMYADTYILLSQADLTVPEKSVKPQAPRKAKSAASAKVAVKGAQVESMPVSESNGASVSGQAEVALNKRRLPSVHIDVQVHISPDTSPEQIDRIFESMAKHLGSYVG